MKRPPYIPIWLPGMCAIALILGLVFVVGWVLHPENVVLSFLGPFFTVAGGGSLVTVLFHYWENDA